MNNNILKKYSAPIKNIESSSDSRKILGDTYRYDITHISKIENENYKIEAGYADGSIAYMNIESAQITMSIDENINNNRFLYHVLFDSDLNKKGIGLFVVSSNNNKSMDIEKFCSKRTTSFTIF